MDKELDTKIKGLIKELEPKRSAGFKVILITVSIIFSAGLFFGINIGLFLFQLIRG